MSPPANRTQGERSLHSRILALALLLLLAAASPAFAYGKSVEDLVGSFSIEKTIKIGSSSECFSSAGAADPLTPPQSGGAGPLADDQPPGLAGFAFLPQQISAAYAPAHQPDSSPHRRPGRLGGRGGIFRPAGRGSCRALLFPEPHLGKCQRMDITAHRCFFPRAMRRASGICRI